MHKVRDHAWCRRHMTDVTYNRILPPGSPSNDVTVEVYNSSKQPGAARVAQHMVLVEPVRGQLVVSESYIFRNDGKMTL